MTIPIVIINPQTGNMAGVWMTSFPEGMVLRIWGFWKESVESWNWTMEAKSWVSASEALSWVEVWPLKDFRISTDRDLKHHKMRRALGIVSIVRIVSLSPRVEESKSLINKAFVSETTEYTCVLYMYLLYYYGDHQIIQHLFMYTYSHQVF